MRVYDAYREAKTVVERIQFVCGGNEYTVKLDEYDDTIFANSITDVSIEKYEYDTINDALRLTLYVNKEVFDKIVSKHKNRKKTELPSAPEPKQEIKASNEPVFEKTETTEEERIYKFTESELNELIEYKVKEKVKDVFTQLLHVVEVM